MKFLRIACLALVVLAGAGSVKSDIVIDPPSNDGFSRDYLCVYKDANGVAEVTFSGGQNAQQDGRAPKYLQFYPDIATGTVTPSFQFTKSFTTTGPRWVYLHDTATDKNTAFVQIEVVENNYQGDCNMQAPAPPTNWQNQYPPA